MKINRPVIFLILGFTMLFLVQLYQREKVDWRVTYSREEKMPFSSYILYDLLDELFPEQKILISNNSFYLAADSSDFCGSNWIFINSVFRPELPDVRKMLKYVKAGNCIFISAGFIGGSLADSLKLKHKFDVLISDSLYLNLTDKIYRPAAPYIIDKIHLYHYFESYDSLSGFTLGTDKTAKTNFIKIKHGEGFFLLHSVPQVFTNYHILKGKTLRYQSAVFSCLPVRRTIWDEYYKESRVEMKSPLRFILNRNSLQWAYFTALTTLILFMIFAARRRQRIIPVIPPLKNDTLDFVKTVGRLYYQHGDHKNLFNKKITYFMEELRSALYIHEEPFSEDFIRIVSSKTNVKLENVQKFIDELARLRQKTRITENDLLHASSEIEIFKKEIKMT